MEDLPYIPYDRSNKEFAQSMRKGMTKSEQRLRFEILRHRPLGYKRIKQKMIDGFIADFYCSKLGLIIEVDGDIHGFQLGYDERRTKMINKWNIEVIRYTNNEVIHSIDAVYSSLLNIMEQRKKA